MRSDVWKELALVSQVDPLPQVLHVEVVGDALDRGPVGTEAVVLCAERAQDGVDSVHGWCVEVPAYRVVGCKRKDQVRRLREVVVHRGNQVVNRCFRVEYLKALNGHAVDRV